jgi:glycosyltransferase involved in cell wall biosynthesis
MGLDYPKISAKCITYARVEFLEELIYSFINQDYPGEKELIIVNDYPLQTLIFEHPEIKIYNLTTTFLTIGEKENYAIERCSGDLIAVFDDDDIALPNHLSNIAKFWKKDTNILHWQKAVYFNEPEITALTAVGNSGIVYSKKAWEKIGKSPLENAGGDMTLVTALHKLDQTKVILAFPEDKECSWFYMWGGRGYHQSGEGTDKEGSPNIIERHCEYIENLRKKGLIATGDIFLNPHWNKDYIQILKNYVS